MIDTNYGKFFYGALGGVIPTAASLAATYVNVPGTEMPTIGLLIGIGLYAFVGGGVALGSVTMAEVRQAVFAGIAAPGIIANALAGVSASKTQSAEIDTFPSVIVGTAHAQEPTPQPTLGVKNDVIIVTPTVTGQYPTGRIEVTAKMPNGEIKVIGEVTNFNGLTAFEIPDGVSQVFIAGAPVDVNEEVNRVELGVKSAPTLVSDFWWALGAKREYGIESINIAKKGAQ